MSGLWINCKKILCVRGDNMGDLIMSAPAFRALKETYDCHITVLTSKMGCAIAPFIPEIDEVIGYDLPWVKLDSYEKVSDIFPLIDKLRIHAFDAAIIFTTYSQCPLPSAMLAWMAGIPRRLAFCRENPYSLLTDWIPDEEPYRFIQHQVERDMKLVESVGACTACDKLHVEVSEQAKSALSPKLWMAGVNSDEPYIIFHPGVSDEKRKYPESYWIELGKKLYETLKIKILITGSVNENKLTSRIADGVGEGCGNIGGLLDLAEFIALVDKAAVVVSVNTGTVHIAAARETAVVVLYAMTNPQHTPWKSQAAVFTFPVAKALKSKNQVLAHVDEILFDESGDVPQPSEVLPAIIELYKKNLIRLRSRASIPEILNNFS